MNLTEEHQEESCVHSNFSCLRTSTTATDVLLYFSVAVVVTLTVCGNLLVIISICHFKQLQTPTNFLLLSLALADFLVGVIVMPLYFNMLIDSQRCFGTLYCIIFHVAAFFLTFVSIYNVALIAVDRWFSIYNPFHYSMKLTVIVTFRLIATLWLVSLIYNLVLLYFNGKLIDVKENIKCGECIITVTETWAIVDTLIVFVLPCLTIMIMYLKIFSVAKIHAKKILCVQKCTKVNNGSKTSERKAAKAIGVLVSVFLLCLVPSYICAFLEAYISNRAMRIAVSNMLSLIYLNSAVNPIIYALFYPWFQRAVKLILSYRVFSEGSSVFNVLATKEIPVH
ncbi:trace amine-associated receptor 13c-like [Anguilla anguilla]|uniref:trace amine-associated receptor 13c-like n=1 Tax=Anguilla anguilla TaxID=7936 RepID=UPI0015AD89F0|nr:trace amine-associated receptor 13c-like [Anguilla anguilla]